MKNKILFIALLAFASLFLTTINLQAQTPSPSPTPSGSDERVMLGGYEVTSSVELGVRGLSVNGNHDKFRSDFNYNPGFRIFDSSFLMEDKDGKQGGFFDSLMITSSGWNADPTGYLRVNIEKMGAYRFDANVRRVHYFNRLNNHINIRPSEPGWKGADTKRNFGDFDLTVLPQNEKFRLRFGTSFYRTTGTAGLTTRPFGDIFPITRLVELGSVDLRAGVDGKLAGFKLSLTVGTRRFDDDANLTLLARHPGVNPTDITFLNTLEQSYPIKGDTKYGIFSAQRSFAKRLHVVGRFIYSVTDRNFNQFDFFTGQGTIRPSTTPRLITSDIVDVRGDAKRLQSRGDFGVTYAVTNNFRISNTFSFDQFDISGSSFSAETAVSQNLNTGAPLPTIFTNNFYYRVTDFKRYVNTIEGDYQFSNRFGINIGYRYTHRKADLLGFTRPLPPSTSATEFIEHEGENSTSTLLIGTRIKPINNWSIFADVEHGESDNSFTRLSNYNFTNFRVRSNWNYKQFTFNVSGISRDNENPSRTSAITNSSGVVIIPEGELIGNVKNRVFSAYVDWSPDQRLSVSTGYTYHHLTSETDIIVPLAVLTRGFSQFFMRDNYFFVDVSAQPINRVSIFVSYRFNKDRGQGDRVSNQSNIIISSYPFRLHMPEVRLAFRLTRNIDWNVGYQYYGYRENLERAMFVPIPPNQNYTAHMPYTSLRIYFGGSKDR